jgi:HEPN domain-containing protein
MAKPEMLQQWLDKGKDDLRSAEYLSTMHHPTPDEIICYLCQQSAEKYLKGFIYAQDIEPDKTHDLEYLLEVCQRYNAAFSTLFPKVYVLTGYGSLPRYPNDLGITAEDVKTAISYAQSIQAFVMQILGEAGN